MVAKKKRGTFSSYTSVSHCKTYVPLGWDKVNVFHHMAWVKQMGEKFREHTIALNKLNRKTGTKRGNTEVDVHLKFKRQSFSHPKNIAYLKSSWCFFFRLSRNIFFFSRKQKTLRKRLVPSASTWSGSRFIPPA